MSNPTEFLSPLEWVCIIVISLSFFFFFLVVVFLKFISFLINICFTFSVVSPYLYRYHVLTIFLKLFDFISRVHTCSPSRSHVMPNVFLFLFLFYLFIYYYYYYLLFLFFIFYLSLFYLYSLALMTEPFCILVLRYTINSYKTRNERQGIKTTIFFFFCHLLIMY